jgi:hypothetical protein
MWREQNYEWLRAELSRANNILLAKAHRNYEEAMQMHLNKRWETKLEFTYYTDAPPRSKVFLEKPTVAHLVNKFPAFNAGSRFITVPWGTRRWSLPTATRVQPTTSHPNGQTWNLILRLYTPHPFVWVLQWGIFLQVLD